MSTKMPINRRAFAKHLLASGALAGWGLGPTSASAYPERAVVQTLREVLNIEQLDQVARQTLSPDAYHFIVGASDDGVTKRANRSAYEAVKLRPRRLIDVSKLDTSVELFGQRYASPIMLAPAGNQQKVHVDGELATARAASARGHVLIAAQMSNYSVAEIAAVGGDLWFQMYPSPNRQFMLWLSRQAAEAGCSALVLTIDGPTRGNHEAARWFAAHRVRGQGGARVRMGNFSGYDGPTGIGDPAFTWKDIAWLRDNVDLPLVLKGIVTAEDARLCRKYGVDGVVVSNHGGRQEGSGRGSLEVLPEVVKTLRGRIPVLVDGGVRRGSDAFKALALGADAVCIGRPYLWGLGAFGEEGVAKCLRILQAELERTMRYAGAPMLSDISQRHVWRD